MSQITTHILDTSCGQPAATVPVHLFQQIDQQWHELARGQTDSDGRVTDLLADDQILASGLYRLHFAIAGYFERRQQDCFYPYVDIVFHFDNSAGHYHVPLLLSPFGYSTYRGS